MPRVELDDIIELEDIVIEEADHMSVRLRADLYYQGMIYLTEYPVFGGIDYGTIIARSFEHAEQRAEERGIGEVVVGCVKGTRVERPNA